MKEILDFTPILYGNCKLVKGSNRSVICDLEKNQIHFIPNDLLDVLVNINNKTVKEIYAEYNNDYDDIICDYFMFLKERNLIFFTKTPSLYHSISNEWSEHAEITNSIIDADYFSVNEFEKIINQLDRLTCKSIQIRFFEEQNFSSIEKLLQIIRDNKSIINSIELIVKYNPDFNADSVLNLCKRFPRITNFILYNYQEEKIILNPDNSKQIAYYTNTCIIDEKSCGKIDAKKFAINTKSFTESLKYNSCLNKKISIDKHGNIKNCPSMSEDYGNIKTTSLQEALGHDSFKKYWTINKDKIKICKDCEFRYVCTDCRAYIENPKDEYSKPLKCGYNPYTNEWEDWSSNPIKQNAIEYYSLKEFKNNDKKISSL